MLSKLTFSLVFVLMLALVAGPAFAQTMTIAGELNVNTTGGDNGQFEKGKFVVAGYY